MKTKQCLACLQEKTEGNFHRSNNSRAADKLSLLCIECSAALPEREKVRIQTAEWRRNNPERSRSNQQNPHFQKTYGIGLEEYEARLTQQNGVCAICKKPSATRHQSGQLRWLSVDHNHATGQVRGLLCNSCNHGLGAFKDEISLLEAAIEYLKKHQ